jgi:hypothetical protein
MISDYSHVKDELGLNDNKHTNIEKNAIQEEIQTVTITLDEYKELMKVKASYNYLRGIVKGREENKQPIFIHSELIFGEDK